MNLALSLSLGSTALNAGVSPPAGYGWLTLNGKFLTLNGKRLMLENA